MATYSEFEQWVQTGINWLQNLPPSLGVMIQLGFTLLLTLLVSVTVYVIDGYLYHRLKKTHNVWDDILLQAIHRPLQWLIWIFGVLYVVEAAVDLLPKLTWDSGFATTREVVIIITVVWMIVRYIAMFEERLSEPPQPGKRSRFDKATTFAVSKLMRAGVALIAGLFLLQVFGVPISGLIAFGGASALVVGIAAREILANFFGGMMIFTDRPFTVGDWISSPDRQIEGTVEHIGWRLTKIRTFARRPMYVPNSLFSTIIVINDQRMYNRRIKTTIGIRYDDITKVRAITQDIAKLLENHPEIDQQQTTYVRLVDFGDSSVDIQIYTFTKTTDWLKFMAIQEEILLSVADIVVKNNAQMPYPTQTLEIPKGLTMTKTDR